MARKIPKLPFDVDAYLGDTRSLSLEARAVWMEAICLMHKARRRGYLLSANGTSLTPEQFAKLAGCSPAEISRALQEIIDAEVASVTDKGTVYSRRMVREEHKRKLCSEAGKKGGGNPALTFKGVDKGQSKGQSKGQDEGETQPEKGIQVALDLFEPAEASEKGCQGGVSWSVPPPSPSPSSSSASSSPPITPLSTPPPTSPSSSPPARAEPPKRKGVPNPLFDAVAEVTDSDPKVSGSHIAAVVKQLKQATPEYTPEEVRTWAEMIRRDWQMETAPTLGMITKYIGRVRGNKTPPPPREANMAAHKLNGILEFMQGEAS